MDIKQRYIESILELANLKGFDIKYEKTQIIQYFSLGIFGIAFALFLAFYFKILDEPILWEYFFGVLAFLSLFVVAMILIYCLRDFKTRRRNMYLLFMSYVLILAAAMWLIPFYGAVKALLFGGMSLIFLQIIPILRYRIIKAKIKSGYVFPPRRQ